MTRGLGYALGAMVCYGLADLVYKRGASAGVPAHQFLMIQSWCFSLVVALYGGLTRTLVFDAACLWGALAGLFAFIGYYNFARSLKMGAVSINAPIFRLSFALTAALAVLLLGEALGAYKLAGLGLALTAVWLLLGGVTAGEARARGAARSSLIRVLVATVAVGIANLLYKVGLRAGATPAALLIVQAGTIVLLSTGFVFLLERRVLPGRLTWRHAPLAAIVLASAFVLMLESLARGEASVLVPIAQMGFVVTAAIGFISLQEPFILRKGVGLACAIAALASLAHA